MKDSTTIILPQWFTTLEELVLHQRMMPRDVTTRWDSTFDMLDFAVEYREALESITGNQRMKMRQYELTEEDWVIATQLRDALKVRLSNYHPLLSTKLFYLDFQGCRTVLLAWYTKHRHGYTCYGPSRSIPTSLYPSKPPLQLARKPSIVTTTKQIIQKCFELRWVRTLPYFCTISHRYHNVRRSAPSSTQTRIF